MAVIKSGSSTDQLTIDPTSKAARVSLYNSTGAIVAPKSSYRAATSPTVVAAAGTGVFFILQGSGSTIIRVTKLVVSGMTLTAVAYNSLVLNKYSTTPSGGTATTLTQVPLDSSFGAGSASLCQVYTAAPTAGTLVGSVGNRRLLFQATTAAAAGIPREVYMETNGANIISTPITLNDVNEGVGLVFGAAPASAVTLSIEVEWTEE